VKEIQLSKGKVALVDDEDFEYLSQWKWFYHNKGYAARNKNTGNRVGRGSYLMHKVIMNTPDGMETDHINGDKVDNRKSNLRICSKSENIMNSKIRKDNTSGYKGVCWHIGHKKYCVSICKDKKIRHVGYYEKISDAVLAYNNAAIELFGEYARLNNVVQAIKDSE
jgi:hypothetical protein